MDQPSHAPNPYLSDPDVQLFLEFQKGEARAFDTLMHKYYKRVLNFLYRYCADAALAEDLTQEVFLKVYENASRYTPQSKLQTWIYTIAHNLVLNELRTRKRKMVSIEATFESDDSTLKRQFEDPNTPSPAQGILDEEKQDIIRKAILSLPENQRTAVLLRRFEDMSYEEIAQAMQTSVQAVKSLLNRAKENLREKLADFVKDEKKDK